MEFGKDNVLLDVDINNKEELFHYIGNYVYQKNLISDVNQIISAFMEREEEVSTGLQDSFAIPHAKSDTVTSPTVLFIKLKKAIEWKTFDDNPVQNVFALLVPTENEGTVHLEMISHIATALIEDEFTTTLKETKDKETIVNIITKAMNGGY